VKYFSVFFTLSYLLYVQTRQLHLPSELVYSCQDVVIILMQKKPFGQKECENGKCLVRLNNKTKSVCLGNDWSIG
jgi:hypothetical protein